MKATEAWRILRSAPPPAEPASIPTLEAGFATRWGAPRFALGPGGEARLLVPLPSGELPGGLAESDALRIQTLLHDVHGHWHRSLDLLCQDSSLETVFGDVVDEILARLKAGHEPARAVRNTLAEFRNLLARAPAGEVSLAQEAGLVAELYLLNRFLDQHPEAWRTWVGPLGDRHDFRCAGLSLEVKSSTRLSSRTITISSIEQLEAPRDGELYLAYMVLEKVPEGEMSVRELASRAMDKASDIGEIRLRLQHVGCPQPDAQEWNRHCFRLEQLRVFRVCNGFPRLIPAMLTARALPAGVVSVTYEIEIAPLQPFEITEEERILLERRLSGCH